MFEKFLKNRALVRKVRDLSAHRHGLGSSSRMPGLKSALTSGISSFLGNVVANKVGIERLNTPIKILAAAIPAVHNIKSVTDNIKGAEAILNEKLESGEISEEEYVEAMRSLKNQGHHAVASSAIGSAAGSLIGGNFSRVVVFVPRSLYRRFI